MAGSTPMSPRSLNAAEVGKSGDWTPVCAADRRQSSEGSAMEFEEIRYEVADHVLTITLNRPERLNAFTPTMGHELMQAFDQSDADDDVRVVMVTGEGRGFCAGADLG